MCDTKYQNEDAGLVGGLGSELLALSCYAFLIYSPVCHLGALKHLY